MTRRRAVAAVAAIAVLVVSGLSRTSVVSGLSRTNVASGFSQTRGAPTPASIKLYVFDGGVLESDPARYRLTAEDVGDDTVVGCGVLDRPSEGRVVVGHGRRAR